MSKIEKALERAKNKRDENRQETRLKVASEVAAAGGNAPLYTQTKSVSLKNSHLEKYRIITHSGDSRTINSYNLLRTQVLQRTRDKGHNTIMVTSVVEGEGKTITAINLAISIAKEVQHTVLLVDTDLRNPKIQHYLGYGTTKGLCDNILDKVPLSELLINPGLGKMIVLLAGKPLSGPTEILDSPMIKKLVQEMKTRYPDRYVIFDCPPLLTMPDSIVFSSYVDGIIIVVEAGKASRNQIREAIELLDGKNILGLVMNKGKEPEQSYYY
ncbi:MAG: polysaccharide biosynthesis tyrosine autokinase [Proteobacteria bacterium]|nr:polysaccharide biosynthesis tyrosine autokinase [Desulfobacteraceae bacterium]MBU4011835.1 polysaccharide biosynthesis tyrosine autokinase [Pseudomonadota bacterium]MBU4067448.1 polysaccharide biosynthesis tyrosine autokinase [Pseudomonadota bacterium]MBU4101326.1 polysaccharide biosynthesis tyrosine autokinase [Pseudomonadota bacterium]MBU4126123.1 polysaccharide biosynthesis tyrosine autokinase [Pseudomonadota bacterium]